MSRLQVFVSSVQKELEDERVIVQNLISTDPFLTAHVSPVLYEYEPASPDQAVVGCMRALEKCQCCILIVWQEYGAQIGDLSITHQEYRRAKELALPILAFIKGDRNIEREAGTRTLLQELDADGYKYKRFGNVIELQKEVRAAIAKLLKDSFGIAPSSDENEVAKQTIEATSSFESQLMTRLRWGDLDLNVLRHLVTVAEGKATEQLSSDQLATAANLRGLTWRDPQSGEHYATAAGTVLLGKDPSAVFPQCRILADAYRGSEPDGNPRDHEDIRGPMPQVIDRAVVFIDRNTRHPMRVLGLNRVRLDEYPTEALREALVNAVAHRRYEDAGRKILVEVFADRVVVSSPGLPPTPITLDKLRKGKYKPCSRNPVLAQCLSFFHRIEERGSGFRRMKEHMLNHGLDQPSLGTDTGYFQVTFPGPAEDLDRLRAPAGIAGLTVTPAIEAQLSDRQKQMVQLLLASGELTSHTCEVRLGVTRPVVTKDFRLLMQLGIAQRVGAGRSTRYRLRALKES